MHLHEEYIKRHKIDIPVVLYKQRSTVLLRSQNTPYRWRILAFRWRELDNHPGFWEIFYNEAVHNGHEIKTLVNDVYKIEVCHWNKYESSVYFMISRVLADEFVAIEPEEQVLAVWQIFLMMYDSWLARHMGNGFFELVGISINSLLPRAGRLEAIDEAQRQLCIDKTINDVWAFQLLPLAKAGSEWLVRLING